MKPSQAIRWGIAAIVLVLLLAACMHPSDSSSSASGSSSGSSTSASTTSPAIEPTTGLESPGSPTGNPSLSLPSPPVGNNHNDGDECITITWLTRPIPHGDIVEITSVTVPNTGLFMFDPGATHCNGGRSCVGYQFSGFNDNTGFCNVGVTYEGEGTVDPGGGDDSKSGTIVLAGRLSCPHISSAKCHDDGVVMEAAARPISFSVDIDSTPSSPPVSPPTSPPTSDSSTPVTPGSS
jgi:hypothetical protein